MSHSLRPLLAALRAGDVAALVADRDLGGDGVPVTMFGHATTLPAGPAVLALRSGRPLLVARVLRTGPDRFRGNAWAVEAEMSGDPKLDAVSLTKALARRFEEIIGANPEQWFAAFQPFWTDQREARRP
jgi:KDO2-lipid IV(A) lauroyltransferase